jgi:predicted Zn-dependent peptidase
MGVTRTELDSGTVVVSEALARMQSVSFGLYFPTGSREETPSTNGISHLIEHLVFKGTPTRTADAINREIDLLGGGVNAFTSKETLCFHARVLLEHLPRAFALIGDLAAHALPPGVEEELERERAVILSEIASVEDSPEDLAGDLVDRAFFGDHPLALPVSGSAPAVARLELPGIRGHLESHLVADHLVVSAAGRVEPDELLELVRTHLADLPRGGSRPELGPPSPSPTTRIAERPLEQAHLCLSARGLSRGDPRRPAAELLSAIVGEGCSSRLFREVRERRGLAYTIYSSLASYQDSGSFHVSFGVQPEHLEETIAVVRRVLDDVRTQGVTDDELETARSQLRTAVRLGHESTGARMAHLAELTMLCRDDMSVDRILHEFNAVDLDSVNGLAEELLSAPLAIGAVGPIQPGLLPESGLEVGG